MRIIYNNSTREKILFYLRDYGDTKRCEFSSIFSNVSRQTVNVAIQRLISDSHIEQYLKRPSGNSNPVRYLTLSPKGKKILQQLEDEHGPQSINKDINIITRPERKKLVLRVYNLLKSENILLAEEDKPKLSLLLSRDPAPISEDDKEKMRDMQDVGAFYSMIEIRSESRKLFGEGPLNQTRCLGVLIRKNKIYFVYNMGSRLVYFNTLIESKTQQTVLLYFNKSNLSHILFDQSAMINPPCLLFGETYGCIPRLFYESRHGELKTTSDGEPVDYGQWDVNKDRLTMTNLETVFDQIYFISIRKPNSMLQIITGADNEDIKSLEIEWIKSNSELRLTKDGRIGQAEIKGTNERIFLWLNNDLTALHRLFKQRPFVHVVISEPGAENPISRIVGNKLLSIRTITGKVLDVHRYDDMGHKRTKENEE